MPQVWANIGGMVGSAVAAAIIGVYQGYRTRSSARGSCATSGCGSVAHLHKMPISFFTSTKTGEIMNRVSSDVDNVDNIVTGTLVTIVTNVSHDGRRPW